MIRESFLVEEGLIRASGDKKLLRQECQEKEGKGLAQDILFACFLLASNSAPL